MTTPPISCSDQAAVQLALSEGRVTALFHCLQKCFDGFWSGNIARQSTPETAEDIFWNAAEALERKSQRENITLTASLCTFFNPFIENYWKKDRVKKTKTPDVKPLDDDLEFYADPSENALNSIYHREQAQAMQQCIAQLSEREQIVVRAYMEGTKDEEIMEKVGYTERTGVAVLRKRTFLKLGKLLEAKGFKSAFFQTEQP